MKLHVFGDTGGHSKQLIAGLESIGVDLKRFLIPKDTRILHLGDLIHKGPGSEYLVALVNILMAKNPGQWVQLLGNHEYQHLGGPSFWRCDCTPEMVMIMRDWVEKGTAKTAYGSDNITPAEKLSLSARDTWEPSNSSWLFTHAGVTYNFWKKHHSIKSASDLADKINSLNAKQVNNAGSILFGGPANFNAGPVWAIGVDEVYNSWNTEKPNIEPPFNQVVGHTTPYSWNRKNWFAGGYGNHFKDFKQNSKTNPDKRVVLTKMGEKSMMFSIDPGFSTHADILEQPHLSFTQWSFNS